MTPEQLAAIAARNAARETGYFAKDDVAALLAKVARLTAALAEAESVNSEFSWEYAAQIAERFGVNESDRRKFGNEMAEVFRAMVKP